MLLGTRIVAQRAPEEDLRRRFRALEDGLPFGEYPQVAGPHPERWRESSRITALAAELIGGALLELMEDG